MDKSLNSKTIPESLVASVSKSVFLFIAISLISCNDIRDKVEKPFVIVDKNTTYDWEKKMAIYVYQDKNGNRYEFSERIDKYSIGDTIK